LADVARALERLERGEYGTCEACGQPIGDARLAARPAARLCLRDQELAEAEESAAAR
jgi:RNA polymerase-binding transcription factor DksA